MSKHHRVFGIIYTYHACYTRHKSCRLLLIYLISVLSKTWFTSAEKFLQQWFLLQVNCSSKSCLLSECTMILWHSYLLYPSKDKAIISDSPCKKRHGIIATIEWLDKSMDLNNIKPEWLKSLLWWKNILLDTRSGNNIYPIHRKLS